MAGFVVVAILIAAMWPGDREPEYGGKKLSEWLDQYQRYYSLGRYPDTPKLIEASDAVRHIGTNAIPWLLRCIRYEQPPWKRKLSVAYAKWRPRRLINNSIEGWLLDVKRDQQADVAAFGFGILGSDATTSVSELNQILEKSKWGRPSARAIVALALIEQARLREEANKALRKMAPEVLEKGGAESDGRGRIS